MAAFAKGGKEGFDQVGRAMEESRSVSEKFAIVMSGLTGFFEKMLTAVKLLSISFSESLSPALNSFGDAVIYVATAIGRLFEAFPILAQLLTFGTMIAASMAAISFVVGGIITGVSGFIAGAVTLTRWFGSVIAWAPRIAAAFGWIAAAVGGLSFGLQALLVIAAGLGLGALVAWLTGGEATPERQDAGFGRALVTPDRFEKPMQGAGGGGPVALGANRGTFFAGLAEQIGIGPQTSAADRTANATERTADGVEKIAAGFPQAGNFQAGMAGVAGQVAAGGGMSDREILNAAEETALNTKQTNELLNKMLRERMFGPMSVAFS